MPPKNGLQSGDFFLLKLIINVFFFHSAVGAFEASGEDSHDNLQSLNHKAARIRELRKNVDDLRALIANKYAEDIGDNIQCTTQ